MVVCQFLCEICVKAPGNWLAWHAQVPLDSAQNVNPNFEVQVHACCLFNCCSVEAS